MLFLPQEIIAKKRDGKALEPAEIRAFVAGLTSGEVKPEQASAFAMAVFFRDMTFDERVALTEAMRDSGTVLDWSHLDGPVLDKHSTGGVGDNVSLILAPILAACGAYVPMISGRGLGHTGGTVDKFDSIPGYHTDPDSALFRRTVKAVGCAVIGQTADLAPADKVLYAIRDVTATVENISLITASILSKKLAAGSDALILDVKAGSGAFMQTATDARTLAESLVNVANGAGVATGALITDMNEPLASAAGNALEVVNAIEFLTGKHQDPRLRQVTIELAARALVLGRLEVKLDSARERATLTLSAGAAAEKFAKMVKALGGPADLLESYPKKLKSAKIVRDVFAGAEGTVAAIDTRAVGMAVVALGGGRRASSDAIDHAVGFDRLAGLGARIDRKTPIARLHANDKSSADEAEKRLVAAYSIGASARQNLLILEELMPKAFP
ncbi:MAG: thymidine phosphorylase [Cucumibacter sp.]